MFNTSGDGGASPNARPLVADGETFEIRYVDAAEAALWACERGFIFGQEDIPPAVFTYFD